MRDLILNHISKDSIHTTRRPSRMQNFVSRHRKYLVVAFAVLALGWIAADKWPAKNNAYADGGKKIVSIYAGGEKQVITTTAPTVRDALAEAKVYLGSGDVAEPGLDTKIPDGFFNVNVYTAVPYRIVDGEKVVVVRSAQRSPQLVAQDADVVIYPEDEVDVHPVNDIAEAGTVGQEIVITRAPMAKVSIDGKVLELRSRGKTVGDLLGSNGISVATADKVSPKLSTSLVNGMSVTVARIRVNVVTEDQVIARPVQQVTDATQPRGFKQVRTEGSDGQRRTTYLVTYNNGNATERKELKTEVMAQPVARVEVVGTKVFYTNETIQLGYDMAAARGWTGSNWDSLYNLWMKESGWNAGSINNGSGACGIPQAYPCSKITDRSAAGQIRWGMDYIAGRYGTPDAAWAHWQKYHSY